MKSIILTSDEVESRGGNKESYPPEVAGKRPSKDVAEALRLTPLRLGAARRARPGDEVGRILTPRARRDAYSLRSAQARRRA